MNKQRSQHMESLKRWYSLSPGLTYMVW